MINQIHSFVSSSTSQIRSNPQTERQTFHSYTLSITCPTSLPPTIYIKSWSWFLFSPPPISLIWWSSYTASCFGASSLVSADNGRIFRPGMGVPVHESKPAGGLSDGFCLKRTPLQAWGSINEVDSNAAKLLGRVSPGSGGNGCPALLRKLDISRRSLLRRDWKS